MGWSAKLLPRLYCPFACSLVPFPLILLCIPSFYCFSTYLYIVTVARAEDLRSICPCFMWPTCQNLGLFSFYCSPSSSSSLRLCPPPPCFPCPHPRVLLLPRFQFQELDILNMADELLSKGFVGLSQDGAKVAKIKVLDSARAFFEKTFSSDGYASPLLLPLSLTICTLSLRMCCFPFLV